ncbi:uncharacterized protein [Branchiostoma lanceolatum]|uniref:uncharacterized protein isoform X1 n=1 Tax=Branchiostoma lanceolatum TaxID=7740 RepID=UPI0034571563
MSYISGEERPRPAQGRGRTAQRPPTPTPSSGFGWSTTLCPTAARRMTLLRAQSSTQLLATTHQQTLSRTGCHLKKARRWRCWTPPARTCGWCAPSPPPRSPPRAGSPPPSYRPSPTPPPPGKASLRRL